MGNKPNLVWDYEKRQLKEPANNRLNRLLSAIGACAPARSYADGKNFQTMWEQCDNGGWMQWFVEELAGRLKLAGRRGDKPLRNTLVNIALRISEVRDVSGFTADDSRAAHSAVSRKDLKAIYAAALRVEKIKGTRYPRNAGPEELY